MAKPVICKAPTAMVNRSYCSSRLTLLNTHTRLGACAGRANCNSFDGAVQTPDVVG